MIRYFRVIDNPYHLACTQVLERFDKNLSGKNTHPADQRLLIKHPYLPTCTARSTFCLLFFTFPKMTSTCNRGSGTGTYDPDRPPLPRTGGASANSGARKMRRIIDDDDDDDDTPIFAPPPQQQARASSMSASRPGSGPSKHGSNSSHGARGGMNGGRSGDRPQSEKKRIIPGPPKAKTAAGTSSQKSGSAGSKRVHDDDEEEAEMDLSFGATHKKTSRDTGGGAGSSRGAQKLPSKNGVRKEASSFKIPKREGASPRPVPASGSPRSGGSGSYGRSSSSSGASGMRKSGHADSGYEPRPSKDLNKKRPDDSRRESGNKGPHREDPAKANDIRKRKLEMEQRLLEEERRKKKKMEAASGKGSASNLKSKVKAEPVRRVSSSSSGKGRAQRPKTAAAAASSAAAPRAPERKFKEKTRKDKIEEAMKVYKWWEEPSLEHGKQWESLEHNGAHFAPEYKPHGVKLKYDGEDVYLTPQQEEIATFYASVSFFCRRGVEGFHFFSWLYLGVLRLFFPRIFSPNLPHFGLGFS